MKFICLLLLSAFLFSADAVECEDGWLAYKDELCVKLFNASLVGYDEAKALCSSQGSDISKVTLLMVKESEFQDLLAAHTHDLYDNVWLGGKYDYAAEEFKWEDGEPLSYTNWQEGYPRNITDSEEVCIELRPRNAKQVHDSEGKWADAICAKKNLVMCQKPYIWTLQDAINEIIRLRKEQKSMNERIVPVGSIYIEYYDQPSPPTLWASLIWEDVTDTYAGLFFRASGGAAAGWGETQTECAPRINEMGFTAVEKHNHPSATPVPPNGWSEYHRTGAWLAGLANPSWYGEALRLHTAGCEVRPRNQAVKIWRRTA